MLDSTISMWGMDMGCGCHTLEGVPFILAGNVNGYFRTGQYLTYSGTDNHTGVLTAVANAMGNQVTKFGDPSFAMAAYSNLKA